MIKTMMNKEVIFNDEKRGVSETDLQLIYQQLDQKEAKIKSDLDEMLRRHVHVDSKLENIKKMLPNIGIIRSEGLNFVKTIENTNHLAEIVSAKVRQLDLARSRVCECQSRVNDILDLQLCSEGVLQALKNEDYEVGAGHVRRYLSMDEALLARTADEKSRDGEVIADSLATLKIAARQLRESVTAQFDKAVTENDLASIERFFKIFPLLGLHNLGLDKFADYLSKKLNETAQKNRLATIEMTNDTQSVVYADVVTLLFESVARLIEIDQPIIETYYGPGRLSRVVALLQIECDFQLKKIINEFLKTRAVQKKVQIVTDFSRRSSIDKTDPKMLDFLLEELVLIHFRSELYIRFLRKKIHSDVEVLDSDQKTIQLGDFETMIQKSELCRMMQEILGWYLSLERYFLEESINKAISMDTLEHDQMASSMVDDVFFIVKKCVRRSIAGASVDGFCAVVNMAAAILETEFISKLKSRLKMGYSGGYLDLTQAYNAIQSSLQSTKTQNNLKSNQLNQSDPEYQRLMFLAYLNNCDLSTEYIDSLSRILDSEIKNAFPNIQQKDQHKVENCLIGLRSLIGSFRSTIDFGMIQLSSSAIKPRVGPWMDAFLNQNHQLNEEELLRYDTEETFVQSLVRNLENLLKVFENGLTEANYDALVGVVTSEVTSRFEKVIFKSSFNRSGGLILDKEIRSLASYLANTTSWSVRDKFARLMQISTILTVDKVEELNDYCGADAIAWRLTPAEVIKVANLRTDLRPEDIKRLKL